MNVFQIGFLVVTLSGLAAGCWLFCVWVSSLRTKREIRHWIGYWLTGNALWVVCVCLAASDTTDSDTRQFVSVALPFTTTTVTFPGGPALLEERALGLCGCLCLLFALTRHWAGRSGRPAPDPAARPARRGRWVGAAGLALAALVLLTHTHLYTGPTRIALHSQAPFQAVRVPFALRDDHIYVRASLNGKLLDCVLDTGASQTIIPHSADVRGTDTGVIGYAKDINGAVGRPRQIVLPHFTLGSYELRGVPAWVAAASDDTEGAGITILGDDAFSGTVLTIDYARRELVLRQPQYDFTSDGNADNSSVIVDFARPQADQNEDDRNVPLVMGAVRGRPGRLLLDTGFAGNCIGITPQSGIVADINKYYTLSRERSRWVRHGYVPDVDCSVTARASQQETILTSHSRGVMFPKSPWNWAADLGTTVLKHYRVTIDYPRRRVLLESNATVKADLHKAALHRETP